MFNSVRNDGNKNISPIKIEVYRNEYVHMYICDGRYMWAPTQLEGMILEHVF